MVFFGICVARTSSNGIRGDILPKIALASLISRMSMVIGSTIMAWRCYRPIYRNCKSLDVSYVNLKRI